MQSEKEKSEEVIAIELEGLTLEELQSPGGRQRAEKMRDRNDRKLRELKSRLVFAHHPPLEGSK